MVELSALWKNLSGESPEQDVRLQLEEAKKNLESYIMRAQQLLGQRAHPGGLISKYKVGSLLHGEQLSSATHRAWHLDVSFAQLHTELV